MNKYSKEERHGRRYETGEGNEGARRDLDVDVAVRVSNRRSENQGVRGDVWAEGGRERRGK